MSNSNLQISDLDVLETLSMDEQAPIQGSWGWSWWRGWRGSLTVDEVKTDHNPDDGKKTRSWTVQWRSDRDHKHDRDRSWTVTYTTDHDRHRRSHWWGW